MALQSKSKRELLSFESVVALAEACPMIVVMSGKSGGSKTTTAVLLSLSLKKFEKKVFFYNLDVNAEMVNIAPKDKSPDFVVINCPVGYTKEVGICVQAAAAAILVVDNKSISLIDGYEVLREITKAADGCIKCHILFVNTNEKQLAENMYNKLKHVTQRFLPIQINLLDSIAINQDIVCWTTDEYIHKTVDSAVLIFKSTTSKLLKIIADK
jgi:MinD-like ATPase involved in chromosome partitioning or flagellar assembly